MAKDPAFPLYSQDFLTGTMFMSDEEVGIYIRLMCAQHQHDGIIKKESFNAKVGDRILIREKFIETSDGFFNERLMEEMVKRQKKSSSLSANALKRWDNHSKSNANASGKHMPIEDVNEIENGDEKEVAFDQKSNFELAWSKYPVKDGKKAAQRSFNASVKCQADMDDLMSAMANYLKSEKVLKGFVKNGSTFFANWQDWKTYVPPSPQAKPPAEMVAATCRAAKMDKFTTKQELLKKGYSEQRSDEAIMTAWDDRK